MFVISSPVYDISLISFNIGPPNTGLLKSKDKNTWATKDVADSVLADKSALVNFYLWFP